MLKSSVLINGKDEILVIDSDDGFITVTTSSTHERMTAEGAVEYARVLARDHGKPAAGVAMQLLEIATSVLAEQAEQGELLN